MKYLLVIALLCFGSASRADSVSDALNLVGMAYSRVYAIAVTCGVEKPERARKDILASLAATGMDWRRAGRILDTGGEAEARRMGMTCDDATRASHDTAQSILKSSMETLNDRLNGR